MSIADYILIFIILLLLVIAVVFIKNQKKKGKNICSGCSGNCLECNAHKK